jgi:sterol desaturase/sphingolipid hydroxylase (fatty acid hydroxylase superfamily)/DNA-binding beta-propeller fold protein YncE
MDWVATVGEAWLNTLGWLAGLACAFGLLARLMPCNPGMYWWKDLRAAATDFMYWFIVPLFLRVCRTLLLIVAVVLLFGGADPQPLPVRDLPLWQQCLAIQLIQDVMLYWLHRAFHTRWAWPFHAIHHSPTVLDWTSTSRFHPVNQLLEFVLADVAVLLMGFAPAALVILAPFNIVYSALVHANLNWTFGPLRYVFASPVFHRWHHTTLAEGLNKNFAPTFPFLDVLFGTFHMPPGQLPEQFGTGDPDFPAGFWGQLVHPFRTRDVEARALKGARRRPAALVAMAVLATVTLLGAGLYWTARQGGPDEQRAGDAGQAEVRPLWAEAPRQVIPLDRMRARAVLGVAISADGHCIVSGSEDGAVRVWDAATGTQQLTLTGHTRPVHGVAISADGHCIVSGSHDRTVKVWDARRGQEKFTLSGHTSAVLGVAVSGDGRHIASASADGTVKVWDAATGQEEFTLAGDTSAVLGVAVSGDGRRIASADRWTVKVWDAQAGRETLTLTGHRDLVAAVAVSPDGGRIVSGSYDSTAKVWDAATGREELTLRGHRGPVHGVAFSPDGKHIVSGGGDGAVKVWDAATGRETLTLTGHTDSVTGVAFSPDGKRIVSGSRDGTVKLWDVQKCERERQLCVRPR